MQDFEKLGVFYLGKRFDMDKRQVGSDLVLYDARDLTTHAVIVGMTGSGKSGLGIAMVEEAAIDAIPSLVIDPKGDLTNLMLTFPGLRPADFRPYLDEGEATQKGLTLDALADKTAATWKAGLAEWGEDGARIQRLRAAADVAIYTPGSSAGLQLSVLRSFDAPGPAVLADPEALRDRVTGLASGLLALLDIDADPLRSREHILLSTLFSTAFTAGQGLDLGGLIRQIQKPPFDRVGVLDLESFYPAQDRFALATLFNNLLASPGFSAWTEGEPLDIGRLLHSPSGKPRVSVLSIAHLPDAQRMFFVSVLLGEVVTWMRAQSGTSSLRAMVYMDEIAGYFPPTAMPPAKRPMLTLLKQARAYGVGVVLATQNPVDLDYKGLANAGTWFVGRLQTERDKLRLLDGLEGAAAGAGRGFDRAALDRILSGLGARVFLLNNVHADQPITFQTRFALSYLAGPLNRDQIRALTDPLRAAAASTAPAAPSGRAPAPAAPVAAAPTAAGGETADRPVLPPEIVEFFLPPRDGASAEGVIYRPSVFGSSRLHFVNAKVGLDVWESHVMLAPIDGDAAAVGAVDWSQATVIEGDPPALGKQPLPGARFAPLPAAAARPQSFEAWKKSFAAFAYQEKSVTLLRCAALKAASNPDESERDFRLRLGQSAKEARDAAVDALRKRFTPKAAALEERRRRAEEAVAREQSDFNRQSVDTAISVGTTILGALFGNKVASVGNLGRARSAARSASRAVKERGDVQSAQADLEAVQQQIAALSEEITAETGRLDATTDPSALALESIEVRPRKGDISIGAVALVWCPWQTGPDGMARPAY